MKLKSLLVLGGLTLALTQANAELMRYSLANFSGPGGAATNIVASGMNSESDFAPEFGPVADVAGASIPVLNATFADTSGGQLRLGSSNGRKSVDATGAADGGWYIDLASDPVIINFTGAITAFGFYGVDIGDFGTDCDGCQNLGGGVMEVTFKGAFGEKTFAVGGSGDGQADFYGFVASDGWSFTQVVIRNASEGGKDGQALDQFMIGDAVPGGGGGGGNTPEPGMLALLGAALLSAKWARRRS